MADAEPQPSLSPIALEESCELPNVAEQLGVVPENQNVHGAECASLAPPRHARAARVPVHARAARAKICLRISGAGARALRSRLEVVRDLFYGAIPLNESRPPCPATPSA